MTTRSLLSFLARGSADRSPATRAALAVALALLASALFAGQAALVKVGARELPALELVFFRGFVSAVLLLGYARVFGLGLASARPAGQLAFGAMGFVSLALYFVSLGMLPLVTASALNYTAPLFVALFVALQSGRRARAMLLWVAGGFAGACLVLQPSLAGGSAHGVAIGLASGFTAGVAYLLLGWLGRSGEPQRVTAFHYSVVVFGLAGVLTLAHGGFAISTWHQVKLVLAIGLLATFAQLALFKAYALAAPVIPAAVSYSVVIFSSLLGAALWGDQIGFAESLGIALIVASGMLVTLHAPGSPADGPAGPFARAWRSLRSAHAAYKLAMDPRRTQYVFVISAAQDAAAEEARAIGRIRDPFAAPDMESLWQQRFRAGTYDIEGLAQLPEQTLGGAYGRHMQAHNLRPDYYRVVEARHRMTYLRQRIHQTHDVWHVLTGYGIDERGEVALQGFYFGQFTSGQAPLICAAFILRSVLRGRLDQVEALVDAFSEGYCAGKRSASLLAVKWEDLWGENLQSLRARFGIAPGLVPLRA